MLLDLVCADCLIEQMEKGVPDKPERHTMTPFEPVNDSGVYEINCHKGHKPYAYIVNLDFEILFDYSINSIADGYYREAVSSFTSAMERYFEFFIKVLLRVSKAEFTDIDNTWKTISNQSERQLGAYIITYLQTFGEQPLLLNTNKEIPFRNNVIHKGYIPTRVEAIEFGEKTFEIIEKSLLKLKNLYPEETKETFKYYCYERNAKIKLQELEKLKGVELNTCGVNILTTIDVMNGREINEKDTRKGDMESHIKRILEHREPRIIALFNRQPIDEKKAES